MSNLPERCHAILLSSGALIEIRRGEHGYYPLRRDGMLIRGEEAIAIRDEMNAAESVTVSVRMAMEHGSMFGWDTPGADPNHPFNLEVERDETTRSGDAADRGRGVSG